MNNGSAGIPHEPVLLAAGTGPEVRGWLLAIDKPTATAPAVEVIDHLNTSGIVTHDGRLYRILSSPSDASASGDFLTYDATGVATYRRLDEVSDSHGLVWDGTSFVVPCSFTNDIVWLAPTGERRRVWHAPGDGDAWHINGVHVRDGRLYASAFGVFSAHRGWAKHIGERTGIIFDVETLAPVVRGLACPHDPIFIDGGWLVADSLTKRLLFIDEATQAVTREVTLAGWTRGVAVSARHIFVGTSGERHRNPTADPTFARIAVLDRATFALVNEILLPCEEISTLALVDPVFLPALRRGFRTNDLRVGVQDRRDLFELAGQGPAKLSYTPMEALTRPRDFRISINAKVPRTVRPGEFFSANVRITNRGPKTLLTAPPFPVNIGVVFDRVGAAGPATHVLRIPLPRPLGRDATARFTLQLQSPAEAGDYRVRFTLLQEWVRWFDTDQRWFARLVSSNRRIVSLRVSAPLSVTLPNVAPARPLRHELNERPAIVT